MVAIVRAAIVRACAAQTARRVGAVHMAVRAGSSFMEAGSKMHQVRSMSVFSSLRDTVTQKMQDRNEVKQADAYRQQVQDLAYGDKFDLDSFHEQLKKNADASGMNGWRSMIPGVSEMTAVQQLKSFMAIVESMDPEFRQNPRLITGKTKRQIIEKSGHSAEELNNLLRNYEQLFALRQWLVKRVERGLPLPETMQETQELVRADPTGFPQKKFRMKQRR